MHFSFVVADGGKEMLDSSSTASLLVCALYLFSSSLAKGSSPQPWLQFLFLAEVANIGDDVADVDLVQTFDGFHFS